ncbi:MAG: glycoside hydrolase family 172 protein [Thermoguttaceae bacterium]
MKKTFSGFLLLLLFVCFAANTASAATVSLESLLDEMVNRDAITQFPNPFYTCKQASSYDRRSEACEQDGWFANGDASQFVREEMNGDRKEWVLMDEKGPGAIVRWWITAPHYRVTFRIYIDGNSEPAITAPIGDLIGGKFLVDAPLSSPRANGRNLYLPIPYEKSIKITVDKMFTGNRDEEQGNLYYQINYRSYPEGTKVQSFSMDVVKALKDKIAKVQRELVVSPIRVGDSKTISLTKNGGKSVIKETTNTPYVINSFSIKVDAKDVTQALRSTLVKVKFDGHQTIRVPLGDFFAGGVGVNPYKTWYTQVDKAGNMFCFWKMPFKNSIEAEFVNYDPNQDVKITINNISVSPYKWTDETMYFHANWRQERQIQTPGPDEKKMQDWNYIALEGKGVFVGDSLSITNSVEGWWGEGDEKIYVDGEKFPSHFGTGTEDYYGYAWCTPEFFEAPFHAQPRAEGPANFGHATNDRFRLLDGIPFKKDFRFDMEVWHWVVCKIDYSVVTYWYGFPGIKAVDVPTGKFPSDDVVIEEIKAKVTYETPYTFDFEGFDVVKKPHGTLSKQGMANWQDGKWHNDDQLWWTGGRAGDKLELTLDTEKSGEQTLVCELTKARDYGKFQFYVDDQKVGEVVDLYNPEKVISTGPVKIGTVNIEKGKHTITVELVGRNDAAVGTMFGLDLMRFE